MRKKTTAHPRPAHPEELRRRLAHAEAEAAGARRRQAEAEESAARALTLFAAVSRLYGARALESVWAALDEIVAATLGARGLGVYGRDPSAVLRLVHARRAGESPAPICVLGEGTVGRAASERRTVLGTPRTPEEPIVAVPLGGVGVLALFDPAGRSLGSDDLQLLEIVAQHAGEAVELLWPLDDPRVR